MFTAEEPEGVGTGEVRRDGGGDDRAAEVRQRDAVQPAGAAGRATGDSVAGSHQWEIVEEAAEVIKPALDELIRQAAQGDVLHNDDTGMRMLQLAREPGDERTGIFTSGIVSIGGGWKIALYFTGRQHAGENLAEVLKQRARGAGRADPDVRCAVAQHAEAADGVEILLANCLAHGRRQFVEVAENFPEECRYVLETLGEVYHNDAEARERGTVAGGAAAVSSGAQRAGDGGLHEWLEAQLAEHKTEPNSGLGKAITYLLRHWQALTLFLRQPAHHSTTTSVERALKRAILHRKNALFYRTLNGAQVGDLFMSLIHTCELNGANPFDYLTELQRHAEELAAKPCGVDAVELPRDAGTLDPAA